jgi:hypothetical protein
VYLIRDEISLPLGPVKLKANQVAADAFLERRPIGRSPVAIVSFLKEAHALNFGNMRVYTK